MTDPLIRDSFDVQLAATASVPIGPAAISARRPLWTEGTWDILPLVNAESDLDIYIGSHEHGCVTLMVPGYKDHPQNIAHAHMGAASTTLYEALETLTDQMEFYGLNECPEHKSEYQKAMAALAKARGEASS